MTQEQIQVLIPVLSPVIVFILRWLTLKFVPKLPKVVWPLLCAGLGVLADWLLAQKMDPENWDPRVALLLGAGGTWLREIVDQIGKLKAPVVTVIVAIASAGFLCGCAMLSNTAETQSPDGSTKNATSRGYAVFQSGQTFKTAQAQAGEVLRVGATDAEQKSEASVFLAAVGPFMKDLGDAFKAAAGGYSTATEPRIIYVTNTVVIQPPATNTP